SAIGVADVHHDFERQIRHGIDRVLAHVEAQLALENVTGVALGARHGDVLAVLQQFGRIAATHHRRDAQLTGDDRRVAGTPATVGDNGAGALHHRLPVRVGHVRHQYITGLHLIHLGNVVNDLDRSCADALPDRPTFHQYGAALL